jgi:hypothetical protein
MLILLLLNLLSCFFRCILFQVFFVRFSSYLKNFLHFCHFHLRVRVRARVLSRKECGMVWVGENWAAYQNLIRSSWEEMTNANLRDNNTKCGEFMSRKFSRQLVNRLGGSKLAQREKEMRKLFEEWRVGWWKDGGVGSRSGRLIGELLLRDWWELVDNNLTWKWNGLLLLLMFSAISPLNTVQVHTIFYQYSFLHSNIFLFLLYYSG